VVGKTPEQRHTQRRRTLSTPISHFEPEFSGGTSERDQNRPIPAAETLPLQALLKKLVVKKLATDLACGVAPTSKEPPHRDPPHRQVVAILDYLMPWGSSGIHRPDTESTQLCVQSVL